MKPKQIYLPLMLIIAWVSSATAQKMTVPDYPIETLIELLRTDNYHPDNRFLIPKLTWNDISKLLEIGNDSTIITKFPRAAYSSSYEESCFVGIMSLWLIESIRITEQRSLTNPMEKFPSLTAVLREKDKTGRPEPYIAATMQTAYQAYNDWWQTTKGMDIKEASKINPLENTTLSW